MIQGNVLVFLNALGHEETNSEFSDVLSLIESDDYQRFRFADIPGEEHEEYLKMPNSGVDFLLDHGVIDTIFIYSTNTKDHSSYQGWRGLVDGVSSEMGQEEVISILGEPLRVTPLGMTYGARGGYLQFEFADGQITQLVVMREMFGNLQVQNAAVPVAGDLAVFIAAVGTPMLSSEHQQALVLGGARMEIEEDQISGAAGETHYFELTGLLLRFRNKVMVGALVRLTENLSGSLAAYPWPERLITGLSVPWSRNAIRERLGDPVDSNPDEELFILDNRYVRFAFKGTSCAEVSIAMVDAEAS